MLKELEIGDPVFGASYLAEHGNVLKSIRTVIARTEIGELEMKLTSYSMIVSLYGDSPDLGNDKIQGVTGFLRFKGT